MEEGGDEWRSEEMSGEGRGWVEEEPLRGRRGLHQWELQKPHSRPLLLQLRGSEKWRVGKWGAGKRRFVIGKKEGSHCDG